MDLIKKVKELIGVKGDETVGDGQDIAKSYAVNQQTLTGFQDLVASLQPKGQEDQAADDTEFLNRLRKEGRGQ